VGHGTARPLRLTTRIRGRMNSTRSAAAPPGPTSAPPAVPRGVILLLGMAGAVVTIGGMRAVSELLGPLFLALMLTIAVSPVADRLRTLGAPTWLSVLATLTSAYLVLVVLIGALLVSLSRLVELMPSYQSQLSTLRDDLSEALLGAGAGAQPIQDAIDPAAVLSLVGDLLSTVLGAVSGLVFLVAALLFMCLDAAYFPRRLMAAAAHRPHVVGALRSFAQGTRRFLWVTTVFGLIVAAVDTVALWALGIPLPLLWGLLSFITNYIPNIGFVIGLVPPALLGFLEGGTDLMLAVIVLYSVVNFVIQSIIQPKVVGDAVGLSTTVSFLSLVFWTWVLGPVGALLAIPLSLLTKCLLVDIDPASRWMRPLISSSTPPAADGVTRPGHRSDRQ
jgi:AI-2 transport protein TqsA